MKIKWTKSWNFEETITIKQHADPAKPVDKENFDFNNENPWFTTLENITGRRSNHKRHRPPLTSLTDSPVARYQNGIYKISVLWQGKIHIYIGLAHSQFGYDERIPNHIAELRYLPLNPTVLNFLRARPGNADLSDLELRNQMRKSEFDNYKELGDFVYAQSNRPINHKVALGQKIAEKNNTFLKQKNILQKIVTFNFYVVDTSTPPTDLEITAIECYETTAFIEHYKKTGEEIPNLNDINERTEDKIKDRGNRFIQDYLEAGEKDKKRFKGLYKYFKHLLKAD
jgi:ferritin